MPRYPVKSAVLAPHPADVGIIDVSAHYVSDHVVRVELPTDMISQRAKLWQVMVVEKAAAVVPSQALA